jgi:hypothetical protein
MGVGALIGAAISGGVYYAANHDNFQWSDFGMAVGSGAVTGALTVVAGPIAGTTGKAFGTFLGIGVKATTAANVGAPIVNAFGGGLVDIVSQQIRNSSFDLANVNGNELATTMILSGLSSFGLDKLKPLETQGMNTLKQAQYFAPGIKGFENLSPNAQAIIKNTFAESFTGSIVDNYIARNTSAYVLNSPISIGGGFSAWGTTQNGSIVISQNDPRSYDSSDWY